VKQCPHCAASAYYETISGVCHCFRCHTTWATVGRNNTIRPFGESKAELREAVKKSVGDMIDVEWFIASLGRT